MCEANKGGEQFHQAKPGNGGEGAAKNGHADQAAPDHGAAPALAFDLYGPQWQEERQRLVSELAAALVDGRLAWQDLATPPAGNELASLGADAIGRGLIGLREVICAEQYRRRYIDPHAAAPALLTDPEALPLTTGTGREEALTPKVFVDPGTGEVSVEVASADGRTRAYFTAPADEPPSVSWTDTAGNIRAELYFASATRLVFSIPGGDTRWESWGQFDPQAR